MSDLIECVNKRQDLIDHINSTSIILKRLPSNKLQELIDWCEQTFEERRAWHPLGEAEQGWLDYFDGDWAYTQGQDTVNFWFENKKKLILFKLKWAEYV